MRENTRVFQDGLDKDISAGESKRRVKTGNEGRKGDDGSVNAKRSGIKIKLTTERNGIKIKLTTKQNSTGLKNLVPQHDEDYDESEDTELVSKSGTSQYQQAPSEDIASQANPPRRKMLCPAPA
jgi:hypothetical protein